MAKLETRTVLVCQNRCCRKQGAGEVLAAFQNLKVPGVTVVASQCLGQCGNGPMVLILPDQVWYDRVLPQEVQKVVQQHLQEGVPVAAMLYAKFHHR